jgi:hypothetical protein
MEALLDLILHLDEHLRGFVDLYGTGFTPCCF